MAPKRYSISDVNLLKSKKARKELSDDINIIKQNVCVCMNKNNNNNKKKKNIIKSPSLKELHRRLDNIQEKYSITKRLTSELDEKKREEFEKDCLSLIRIFDFRK